MVDALLAASLVLIMATPVVHAQVHEGAGVAFVVLVVVHVALDAKRVAAMAKRRNASSMAFLVVELLLAAGIFAMAASSIVLSEHAFAWLPVLPGAAWARSVHAAASGWLFVLAFFHAGMHVRKPLGRHLHGRLARGAAKAVLFACAVAGAMFLVRLGMWESMTLQTTFAAIDASTPLVLVVGAYAVVALGSAACGCAVVRNGVRRLTAASGEDAVPPHC